MKTAYGRTLEDAQETLSEPVPLHLRNAVTPLMKGVGYGADYQYDHDADGHCSGQEHLPASLSGRRYCAPTAQGAEAWIKEWLEKLRGRGEDYRAATALVPSRAATCERLPRTVRRVTPRIVGCLNGPSKFTR